MKHVVSQVDDLLNKAPDMLRPRVRQLNRSGNKEKKISCKPVCKVS